MKKILVLCAMLFVLVGCDNVPVGNVGIIVHKLGGSKGVDSEEVGVGRYWLGINDELFTFPTYSQNESWVYTRDRQDESITFQTKEGLSVNADIGITYNIQADKVSTVFQKYRKGINEISDIYLRNMVRDALVKEASTRPIESVYGEGKADLIEDVEKLVRSQVQDIGINVEKINWMGDLRLPSTVVEAINAKIGATQKAAQRENEVAQAKAEADKVIETARGEAESKLAIAKAEAQAIEIKGKSLRDNPNVIELNKVEKWNGVLPQYMTGPVPFVNVQK